MVRMELTRSIAFFRRRWDIFLCNTKTRRENLKQKNKKGRYSLVFECMKGYGRYLWLGLICVFGAALAGYISPIITSFTVDYVLDGKTPSVPAFVMKIVDSIGGREYLMANIMICVIVYVIFRCVDATFVHLRGRCVAELSEGLAKNLRDKLYEHLQNVPYDYHKHVSTGDLIQRCTSDVETVRRFFGVQLLEISRTLVVMVMTIAIMSSINVKMTLISIISFPFLIITSYTYFKKVMKIFMEADEAEGVLSNVIQENLTGVRVVRAFGQQKNEMDKFDLAHKKYSKLNMDITTRMGFFWGGTDAMSYMQICITLVFATLFAAKGEITVGNVMLFTSYAGMVMWPVRSLGRMLADFGKATVALGRLDEIVDEPLESEPGKALKPDMSGDIVFDHVCFGYDTYDDVLKDISFRVKQGSTIAILGSTGSGKSSLVQLLQRLYTVTSGEITINGTNINDIDAKFLRSNIGIVLQEPFLYSRTIMENIRIVNPEASEEEVYNAAKIASVHDAITGFDKGYDTLVGERGVTLSGGQQQRVAIARTLMQKTPILIFDDSMSAVDTETDAQIRKALKGRKGENTMFIISHRITTLMESDMILVLEGGRLTQMGTHEELLNQDGLYRRIALIQDMVEQAEKEENQ